MFLISIISLIILNGLAFLVYTLILQLPYIELLNKTWIILILMPLFQGIVQALINRNGMLTIESPKLQIINNKIEELLSLNAYVETNRTDNSATFEFLAKWKKIFSVINNKVIIKNEENLVVISGKRTILKRIESKIKWNNELNSKI